ncbi:hypothetical protein [Atopobacter phocae]|uniref:hypothetical protein n=1 Tax=Atopobacter phocae TaxID=136492 RepID=UPI0004BB28F5|nr:hypothetical protein [Atopobacter phocae]
MATSSFTKSFKLSQKEQERFVKVMRTKNSKSSEDFDSKFEHVKKFEKQLLAKVK